MVRDHANVKYIYTNQNPFKKKKNIPIRMEYDIYIVFLPLCFPTAFFMYYNFATANKK
jgi:hypothetical protein